MADQVVRVLNNKTPRSFFNRITLVYRQEIDVILSKFTLPGHVKQTIQSTPKPIEILKSLLFGCDDRGCGY